MELLDAEARRAALAGVLAEQGFVAVAEASGRLGVSEVPVRADLTVLAARGVARRVHGGAVVAASVREAPVEATASRDAGQKRAIGAAAAALVRSGSSIMLDVGSTTQAVASALVARTDLSDVVVITNGLSIALTLEAAIPRFTVIVTGGSLRALQHSLVDSIAADTLRGLHADLAVLGCTGVADGKVTNVNLPEAAVKRAMIAASSSCVLVADTSKFGRRDLSEVAPLETFGTVVTAGPQADAVRVPSATRLVIAA
jgi:DeoR family transcriptional regulator of aga operon